MKKTSQNKMTDNVSQQDFTLKQQSIVRLQAATRGFLARQHYHIREINTEKLESYYAFIVGNDPCLPDTLSDYAKHNEKIALVGTSCIRNIAIACELGKSPAHTPKIFIVDNSLEVHQFWQQFRTFMTTDSLTLTHAQFTANLPQFLENTKHLCRQPSNALLKNAWDGSVKFPDQDAVNYMQSIIDQYGYERFRAVARHVSLIKQSWEDRQTFTKLRNIINLLGIQTVYTYPSNIVTLMFDHPVEDAMLDNIQLLSPKMSIHVLNDITRRHFIAPKEVKLVENNQPDEARITLGLN